jgi:hypothetical protein
VISGVVTILSEHANRRPSHSRGSAERTEADRSRSRSQSDEILQMLRSAGEQGCTNLELWSVAHAAHSRIADLRALGHRITCRKERSGVYRYVLEADAGPRSITLAPARQVKQSQPALITMRPLPLFDAMGG